ncbi:hypothetical protein C7974DRAFT_53419 [Boeremia exigua]|uniref:uncharacterized protein n=1 Tax=Boeremia exigua TaxID=749465 RepID=UPI001E8CDCCC|nr:uncharacterized protein C7974DRAFT_53419 [Boeremia exigua]KAH6616851.1 hypothetical protein C7974DRAFT_53419 [Boeremia exigua]
MVGSTNTSPAFTRLPTELLIQILEQQHYVADTYERNIIDFATLKSLRLACRQYAYLPALLADIFQHIRIEASPEQVKVAELLDLSSMKPYVKAITMVPSKYTWTMTEGKFQHIIWSPRAEEIFDEKFSVNDSSALGRQEIKELGLVSFVEKHTDGAMPFTKGEVATGYERYMQHARRTREMFETKQIDRAWSRLLAELPDVDSFNIGLWNFDSSTDQNWRKRGCDLQIHGHGYGIPGHEYEACRQLHAPVGEALFRAAIAALTTARSNVSRLEIECVVDGEFTWADDETLDGLNLSRLQSLVFDPIGADWREAGNWSREHKAAAGARCGLALVTLLNKCSSSLRELSFFPQRSGNYFDWPPAAPNWPPVLPALGSLTTGTGLDLSGFARFLLQSPALVYLRLDGSEWRRGEWRELWDAIRNHPNRMTLNFDQLPCSNYGECSVYHYTGEASTLDSDEDQWDNVQYCLENYLSGRSPWNRTLTLWFEESDFEFSDSDNDESDSAENDSGDDTGIDVSTS